jgi:hypothetical protein
MDIHDVIQAFVDGEPVDPVELEQALADPEGRAHLVDLVVLRKLVRRSHVAAGRRADLQIRPPFAGPKGPAYVLSRRLRAVAAAAIVAAVASVGGYLVGERATTSSAPTVAVTPAPPRGSETARSGGPDGPPYEPAPPAPTVVIRFQPGVDWTESGGH